MEERYERIKQFGLMHSQARISAGKSQEYMSAELHVSKKTIQNWEKGISQPTFFQSVEWFKALGVNPCPYYLEYYYGKTTDNPTDDVVEREWEELTKILPTWVKRAMMFIFFGRHGSSPASLMQLTLAHIHAPLKSRVINATIIKHNYEMADAQNELICKDNILPDMEMLNWAINEGRVSAIKNDFGYALNEQKE